MAFEEQRARLNAGVMEHLGRDISYNDGVTTKTIRALVNDSYELEREGDFAGLSELRTVLTLQIVDIPAPQRNHTFTVGTDVFRFERLLDKRGNLIDVLVA